MMRIFFVVTVIIFMLRVSPLFSSEDFKYDSKGKRDPFVPLVSEEGVFISDASAIKSIKDVRLEGIVWDEVAGSLAVINGEIVKEGTEIGSLKVLSIERDWVVFSVDGEEVKVELDSDM